METVTTEEVLHKGEKRIKLVCRYNPQIVGLIKTIEGRRWSKTMKATVLSRQGTFAALTGYPQKPKAAKEPCSPSHATAPRNDSPSIENKDYIYLKKDKIRAAHNKL